ncbi:ATP-binding protein [Brumicola nitratireducens]|uniref:histidine kinase n=1 Tax=Glaciecola nitratireducens (strain JCM 12485 / KCTC 12276 / FR1064) TaxID=1085623 RepID=G4QER3_GLANF|nr:ATP-binding protein [Glaciecola nitratireducens]AEP29602.1 multi-sensor hybrid histidine kinase [Glaciecola nitratireducens FR1064]
MTKQDVNDGVWLDMTQALNNGEQRLNSALENYRKDLFILHDSPPVLSFEQQYISGALPNEQAATEVNEQKAQQMFIALMKQSREIDQVRLIDVQTGLELVKVDRTVSGQIVVIQNQLQDKSGRDYFEISKTLLENEYYISGITLNREFGQIETPIIPTLRLAMPVRVNEAPPKTILIVNINAHHLLRDLTKSIDGRFQTYLLNDKQEFLIHPDADVAFRQEFDGETNLSMFYRLSKDADSRFGIITEQNTEEKSYIYAEKKLVIASEAKPLIFNLLLSMDTQERNELIKERRIIQTIFISVVVIFLVGLLVFFNLYMKRKAQLTRAQSEYKAIIEGTNDAIISISVANKVTTVNNAALSLFSKTRGDFENKYFDDFVFFQNFSMKSLINDVVSSKKAVSTDVVYSSPSGEKQLTLNASPVSLSDGDVEGVAVIFSDVTARFEAKQKIETTNRSLEEQVRQRTKELNKAKKQAEATSHTKSSFISNVSHEMRTPLNGILGTLELIRAEGLNDNQLGYMNLTDISITNLSNLINDILDLSKIEAGKLEFRHENIDLLATLEDTVALFQPLTAAKGVKLHLDTAGLDILNYYGDGHRVKQVLNNLLSNAVKFTAKGSIVVVARSQIVGKRISFGCSVIDTGVGIAKVKHEQIFVAFDQGGVNTAQTYGGTGLGLSITKQLCKLMDGKIWFTSEQSKGTCFSFEISSDAGDLLTSKTAHKDPLLLGGLNILLLLDDQQEYSIVRGNIESIGGNCFNEVESNCVDIILADESLPDLSIIQEKLLAKFNGAAVWLDYCSSENRALQSSSQNKSALTKPFFMTKFCELLAPHFPQNKALQTLFANLESKIDLASIDFSGIEKGLILIADDNEINLAILRGMLEDTPFTVFTTKNGQEVIDFLNKTNKSELKVDLLLLDCNMPIMDGFECVHLIRDGQAGEENKALHVIAATADAMLGDREKCLAAGMDDYIAKPISKKVLFAHINEYWIQKQNK